MDIKQLIIDNGAWFYAITFAWTFLEGETFVIFAGAASSQGMLNIYVLIAVAWIGSFCGDQMYFFIGRRFGKRLLKRFPKLQGGVMVALDMLHKYHVVFILTYRFIYGVRNFASFAMGMSELPWSRFVGLNFIAATGKHGAIIDSSCHPQNIGNAKSFAIDDLPRHWRSSSVLRESAAVAVDSPLVK